MNGAVRYARSQGHGRSLDRMVVVCHSMGGLITRSSVTDPGTALYDAHFGQPLDQLQVSPATKRLISDGMLYRPLKEPKRVIFMAVPHHGSPMANMRFAMMTSHFIRLPKLITVDLLDAALHAMRDAAGAADPAPRMPTSISTLSPSSRAIQALSSLPLPRHIAFHSIHGNRGKGEAPDCSDGVVPYRSSCVSPVVSETTVPWSHGVTDCPVAAEEVGRILRLHLETTQRSNR